MHFEGTIGTNTIAIVIFIEKQVRKRKNNEIIRTI